MIQERILDLADYGLATGLITPLDKRYTINKLLELFELEELENGVVLNHKPVIPTPPQGETARVGK